MYIIYCEALECKGFKTEILTLEIVTCKLKAENYNDTIFSIQVCLRVIFLNHLAPRLKGELMPKAPFVWPRVHVIGLYLIAFIISIETEASLLALATSIYCILLDV